MLLAGALFALHHNALVKPIDRTADWASRIRQGDFSARLEAKYSGLYALTDDINRLAEWLEWLAELKNQELLEQAARLKEQTDIVRLLYQISADFSQNAADFQRVHIPMCFGERIYGECAIWFARRRFPLPDEFSQLLYALGRNIGLAFARIELGQESDLLSRMRERTHLANELHDSLAQTMVGLRFQARILDDLLHQQEERAAEIPQPQPLEITRIIQEALTNIRQHREAKNARLLLRVDDGQK